MRTSLIFIALLALGCPAPEADADAPPRDPAPRPLPQPTRVEAPERVIALGDIHGDIEAMWSALRLAELVDDDGGWTGGTTVVVQTGDQLDRGDDERAIMHALDRLADEAHAAGGAVYTLNGNHETMNVELDLRYVTDGGWTDFGDLAPPADEQDDEYEEWEPHQHGRVAAFRPGGPYARLLAKQNTVMVVGETLFVHGGVLPEHTAWGLENINRTISDWMLGDGEEPADMLDGDGPLWRRDYSDDVTEEACAALEQVFTDLDIHRMVVGHTRQSEPNVACFGQVWRIDVGMARYYGGDPAVIEIVGDDVSVID